MPQIIKLFGDSYREISEINIMTFSLGLVLGFLLGMLPIPLPGGLVFPPGHRRPGRWWLGWYWVLWGAAGLFPGMCPMR